MKKEPIRHHYIPRFILRNFCFDDNENTFYQDVKGNKESVKRIGDLYMQRNLYRDTINADNPVKIEEDFARFENEVAPIIKDKFLDKEEFLLTNKEHEKLKLFFALMSFRSKATSEYFKKGLSKEGRKVYSTYQRNKNFEDFWKRNLGRLIHCRSLQEVIDRDDIDEPIKVFMMKDTFGFFGKYFCVVEPKDIGEFVLSDCYPVAVTGEGSLPFNPNFQIGIYDVYPLSSNRAILLAHVGCQDAPEDILRLRPLIFNQPIANENNEKVFRVKKLFLEEVEAINELIIKHAEEGFIYKNKRMID